MKTKAHCPTCNFPFSFWRVFFAYSPFSLYCKRCRWHIDIVEVRKFMWGVSAGLILITFSLMKFIIAGDMVRLLVLAALWLVLFFILDIIISLMIVNWAHFSKPDQSAGGNGSGE